MIQKIWRRRETSQYRNLRFSTSSSSWIKRRTNQRKSTLILISRSENLRPPRSWMWWKNSKLCRFLSNRECSPCIPKQGSWGLVKSFLLLPTARYCPIGFSSTGLNSVLLWSSTTTWSQSTTRARIGSCTKTMTKEGRLGVRPETT